MKLVVLTGFLGAGKTTILNRVLAAAGGRRLAVIVNDLGKVNIDKALLQASAGDMVELAGGCVCCTVDVNRDLWQTLPDIVARARPEMVILETTGAAEPGPLVAGARERGYRPLVACAVDASSPAGLGYPEAEAQADGADGILLTKLDLARADDALATHRRLDELGARAPRVSFPVGRERALTAWLCDELRSAGRPPRPARTTQLAAVSVIGDDAFLAEPLAKLLERFGDDVLRVKGFVRLAGDARRAWVEKAGRRIEIARDAAAPGRTEMVLIGPGLDEAAVLRQVWACAAGRQ